MPKEIIANSDNAGLTVAWGRDAFQVQLGIALDLDGAPDDPRNKQVIALGTRGQVNHLILALRKARDQAFGEDA